jgi:hypothetical protein
MKKTFFGHAFSWPHAGSAVIFSGILQLTRMQRIVIYAISLSGSFTVGATTRTVPSVIQALNSIMLL